MKIISIDPGYERLGIAVVEKVDGGSKEKLIFSECFRTSVKDEFNDRLLQVGQRIKEVITEYKPEALTIEKLYFSSNQKTAIQVSQVIGSIIFLAKDSGLKVFEYTPLQIKLAVAGNGKGSKDDVITMLRYLIDLPNKKMLDDEYDAIAVGLTYFAHERFE
ncbi:MAG: crossover junction endodeoxyribonuclease RuvC [Candidatus Pacebacteria bacterium]|nr:crossover junction endodeoxyribonuclease RuvC [Candidatus Paceibacterota bacterium]